MALSRNSSPLGRHEARQDGSPTPMLLWPLPASAWCLDPSSPLPRAVPENLPPAVAGAVSSEYVGRTVGVEAMMGSEEDTNDIQTAYFGRWYIR